ncbi:MAG: 2-octaprenyl-6-methoxyphenyl hydroxylase [Tahibacter sp.]
MPRIIGRMNMHTANKDVDASVDVLIVGGGLVGASLAIALSGSGLRVALVESGPPAPGQAGQHSERNLALARASINALGVLGVWPRLAPRAASIQKIHVSRAGEFGALRLGADDLGVEALGAVVPASELGVALNDRVAACTDLQRHSPAEVVAIADAPDCVEVTLRQAGQQRSVRTRLLVGADGTNSFVRNAAGIGTQTIDYAQTLFVGSLRAERAPAGCAYERFSDAGPVALLPLPDGRAGLVLSVASSDAATIASLDDAGWLALAQERFGWRVGRFSRPGPRSAHPIRRVVADRLTSSRMVLVGNAAQTIHPIGAQGFNLGLRDALTLAEVLIAAVRQSADPGDEALLGAYVQRREEDRSGTLAFSDGLVRLACSPAAPLRAWRGLGLAVLDGFAPLKNAMARRGMGYRGTPTAYALGRAP